MDAGRMKKIIERKMRKISRYLEDDQRRSEKDKFMEKYMLCEAACREILYAYNKDRKRMKKEDIQLNMQTIPSVMNKAGYQFDKELLTAIFGSSNKRGEKSAKKLRNGIAHSFCVEDMDEAFNRRVQLHQEMDKFLKAMSTPPSPQKNTRKHQNIRSPKKAA